MKKILILVEGQTEERFVKLLLDPYFSKNEIYVIPKVITTRETEIGVNYKGGSIKYSNLKKEIKNLLDDSSTAIVTTMLDYYKFPKNDLPGYRPDISGNYYSRVLDIEDKFNQDIYHPKFIPYLQLHEFEAYLLSSSDGFAKALIARKKQIKDIEKLISQFSSPEEIDDNENATPSKRIKTIFPRYQKAVDGPLIAGFLGIDIIRKSCSHFNEWIKKLENS